MYEDPTGAQAPRIRFQPAAVAFTHWMVDRGVLNPLDGERPGAGGGGR